jgi:hypothetical protein
MAQSPKTPPIPSVLGIERREFTKPPLISDQTALWGIFCLRAGADEPRPVAWHRSEDKAQRALAYLRESTVWSCLCGQRYEDHRLLATATFADQRQRDQAEEPSQRATDAPVEPGPSDAQSQRERWAKEPSAEPKKRPRGPHADRLDKARAAHEAATRPTPAPETPDPVKDPFAEEDV